MNVCFFETASDFRKWLEQNHRSEKEIWVGYYNKGSRKTGMSYGDSVDEAICFGWIDGTRRSVDEISYCNRFTPRRASSTWSAVNIRKVEMLISQGRMHQAGIEAFNRRKEEKSVIYSYENAVVRLSDEMEEMFRSNEKAWLFFSSKAPSYQRTSRYWIMDAKQEITKMNRLKKLIQASEAGEKLYN